MITLNLKHALHKITIGFLTFFMVIGLITLFLNKVDADCDPAAGPCDQRADQPTCGVTSPCDPPPEEDPGCFGPDGSPAKCDPPPERDPGCFDDAGNAIECGSGTQFDPGDEPNCDPTGAGEPCSNEVCDPLFGTGNCPEEEDPGCKDIFGLPIECPTVECDPALGTCTPPLEQDPGCKDFLGMPIDCPTECDPTLQACDEVQRECQGEGCKTTEITLERKSVPVILTTATPPLRPSAPISSNNTSVLRPPTLTQSGPESLGLLFLASIVGYGVSQKIRFRKAKK